MDQKGYQRIELIPLLVLIRDHNGDSTVYVYDGNGNLVSKTDADGYVSRYSVHNSKRVYTKICTKSDALLDATQEIVRFSLGRFYSGGGNNPTVIF